MQCMQINKMFHATLLASGKAEQGSPSPFFANDDSDDDDSDDNGVFIFSRQ